MLAINPMSPTLQGILFLVAVVLFVLGAVSFRAKYNFACAGLAFFAFVFMWNAFAAS